MNVFTSFSDVISMPFEIECGKYFSVECKTWCAFIHEKKTKYMVSLQSTFWRPETESSTSHHA